MKVPTMGKSEKTLSSCTPPQRSAVVRTDDQHVVEQVDAVRWDLR
jgi:hypothetical protein